MAENTVEVPIGLETQQVDRQLKQLENSFGRFGKSLQSTFKASQGTIDSFKGTLGGLVAFKALELGVKAAGAAFTFLADNIGKAVDASAQQEDAVNRLNASLQSTGRFTRETSQDLQAFASSLQASSKFGDEVVVNNLAVLSSLTQLDQNGLKVAAQSAADLATALGTDLESATRLVAKAANGNVTALQRYGIIVQQGATNAETFANAIGQIQSQLGGAAASALNTYSGAVTSLNNSYGDFLEVIGDAITKNPVLIGLINAVRGAIERLSSGIDSAAIGEKIGEAVLFSIDVSRGLLDLLDVLARSFIAFKNSIEIGFQALPLITATVAEAVFGLIADLTARIPIIGDVFKGVADTARAAAEGLGASFQNDIDQFYGALENKTAIGTFSDTLGQIKAETIAASAAIKGQSQQVAQARIDDEENVKTEILNKRRDLRAQLVALQAENDALDSQLEAQKILAEDANNEEALLRQFEFEQQKILITLQAEEEKAALLQDAQSRKLAADVANQKATLALRQAEANAEIKFEQARRARLNQNLTATSQFLQAGLALAKQGSKEQQALAVGNALVSTYQAVANALATKPFLPAGLAAAALATAQGIAAVRNIRAQKFATGGIVGGNSLSGDRVPALVNSREMILNMDQQKSLFNQISGGGNLAEKVDQLIDAMMSRPNVIQIDGREIARTVRDQRELGFAV